METTINLIYTQWPEMEEKCSYSILFNNSSTDRNQESNNENKHYS